MGNSRSADFTHTKGRANIVPTMHFHPHWEMYFLMHGNVEFISKNFHQRLAPNQFVLIPPGEYYMFHVLDNAEEYERCVVSLYSEPPGCRVLTDIAAENKVVLLSASVRMSGHFGYLAEHFGKMDAEDFDAVLSAVIVDILYLIKYSKPMAGGEGRHFCAELIKYIDENFTKPIDLAYLAGKYNYSVSHISHEFKKRYDISIKKYILQKRLCSAHAAILQGEKAEEACYQYGFANYSTFYREYIKTFGASPLHYRRENQKKCAVAK